MVSEKKIFMGISHRVPCLLKIEISSNEQNCYYFKPECAQI
jgi:hypothetical protein